MEYREVIRRIELIIECLEAHPGEWDGENSSYSTVEMISDLQSVIRLAGIVNKSEHWHCYLAVHFESGSSLEKHARQHDWYENYADWRKYFSRLEEAPLG